MKSKRISMFVLMLWLGPLYASLTPDAPIQMQIELPAVNYYGSAVDECLGSTSRTSSKNVRLQKFTTTAGTTFVRNVLSSEFAQCYNSLGQETSASSLYSCAEAIEQLGLKMFSFDDSAMTCTGFPVAIPEEQRGCTSSGSQVFYSIVEATARADITGTKKGPAYQQKQRQQQRQEGIETMSTDVIVTYQGFKFIQGKGLSSDQTYKEVEVVNNCLCHQTCLTSTSCNAYSARELGPNSVMCSLADDNVYTNTPSSMDDSYYAVRADLVLDELELDNLIYRRLDDDADGFFDQRDACEAVPGFRLVAVRFQEQMPILLDYCLERAKTEPDEDCASSSSWFFVDMVKGFDQILIRNELPLSETNIDDISVVVNDDATKDVFIYAHSLQLHDETRDKLDTRPVCQANVFGVAW